MADPAAPGKAPEPKYDYPGHAADDTAIKTVEDALAAKYPESYKDGLAQSAKDAPVNEADAKGQIDKAKQDAAAEEKSNPKAQEEKKSEPAPPTQVAAIKPAVHTGGGPAGGPKAPQGGAPAAAPKAAAKGGAPKTSAGGGSVGSAPSMVALATMSTSGDADLDKFLDGYNPKSKEPSTQASKIKQMSEVAKGFDSQLDSTVNVGGGLFEGAKAKAVDFLGKKEMAQTFGDNPYHKVNDQLGGMMEKISRVQGFVSIVGNVCGKLGMVLTILGLFGFIFPPIGAAIQLVARILNVIGIVCDVLGAILSGVLVGLNGVVLARMIGKGGSNEEKAAVADLMMGEANAAGGHLMNLALAYGGNFMKGFKSASKGILGNLMKRFKSFVGKFASKALGPVVSWAKKMGYKLGFGLEKAATAPGMLSKAATKVGAWGKAAWNSPGKLIEKAQETSFVKGINESTKGLERMTGKVNNSWVAKLDGAGLEGIGKKAGEKIFTKSMEKRLEMSAEKEAELAFQASEKNAITDAGNKERAEIEKKIKSQRANGNDLYNQSTAGPNLDEGKAVASREAYEGADKLAAGENKAVATAEKKAGTEGKAEFKKQTDEAKADKAAEGTHEAREEEYKKEFLKDPTKFQKGTERLEKELKDKERLLANPIPSAKRKAAAQAEADEIKQKLEQRGETSQLVGGKESEQPSTLGDLVKFAKEPYDEYREDKDKEEERLGYTEETKVTLFGGFTVKSGEGGHKETEDREHAERGEKIEAWEAQPQVEVTTSSTVESMLSGLDEELGMEPHDPTEHKDDGGGAGVGVAPGGGGGEGPGPANEEKKDETVSAAPTPAAPQEEKKDAGAPKDAETPELAYWPKLVAEAGDFSTAATELFKLKKIAFAFRKAQAAGKKKAVEAAQTYNAHGDYVTKQEAAANAHKAETEKSKQAAEQNSGNANASSGKADAGKGEQAKSQGTAGGQAQPGPDPGDKPSLLHPIKRIWWYVKKWVSDKAAAVFGWIQEKIASMVLKVICGVTMDQLKGYTAALHHRMDYSKLVGEQGVKAAGETMAKSMDDKTKAKTYEQEAIEDAAECDQNMAEADAFMQQVEDSEREVVAETAKAKQFIADLHAAVQAEKAKAQEEKAKAAATQQQGAGGGAGGAPPIAPPTPKAPTPGAAPTTPKPLNPAAVSKVQNTAKFVADSATRVVEQLTSSKKLQRQKLKEKVSYKGAVAWVETNTRNVGDSVVAEAQAQASTLSNAMSTIANGSPSTAAEVQQRATTVRSKAGEVDTFAHHANEQLNAAFKQTYDALTARH